jgi:hypothetical protein
LLRHTSTSGFALKNHILATFRRKIEGLSSFGPVAEPMRFGKNAQIPIPKHF